MQAAIEDSSLSRFAVLAGVSQGECFAVTK